MRLLASALLTLASTLLLVPAAQAQTGQEVPEMAHYDAALTDLLERWRIPGAAVAVAHQGRLVYARGFGVADEATGEPVQPDSRFRIASISKPITAVAVMTLVENGRLELDEPAFALLDDLPPPDDATEDPRLAEVTVRDLLQHSGGWDRDATGYDPMFDVFDIADQMGVPRPAGAETIIRYMRGRPLDFDPGTQYAYSNFGYNVLGRIIERVTGQPYERYVQEVLAEAGIGSMAVGGSLLEDRLAGEVTYYEYRGGRTPSVFPPHEIVPWPYGGFNVEALDAHGGWVSSAPDLLRFMEAIDRRPGRPDILSAAASESMTTRPDIPEWAGSAYWYGLGLLVNTYDNWWHDGSLPGTRALLVRASYRDLSYAVLMNTRPEPDNGFFGELDRLLWNAAGGTSSWPTHDLFDDAVAGEAAPQAAALALSIAPNPSYGEATVALDLPAAQRVRLVVYDLLGREVAVLHDGAMAPGPHRLPTPLHLAPGVYLARLTGEGVTQTRTFTVAR